MAVSNRAWSDFTQADYTPEQWHAACLIHLHEGRATAKEQCKLPVREPSGTLNRNAVHAAASVLAGGRGGVQAPAAAKAAAARRLASFYRNDLKEDPPDSLASAARR